MTKKMILTNSVESIGWDLCDKTIDEAIEVLQRLKSRYEGKEVVLEFCLDGWDLEYNLHVKIRREETDDEYETRLADEKARKERQEERDRKEFERLQKQFGNK